MKTHTHFRLHIGLLLFTVLLAFSCADEDLTRPNPVNNNNNNNNNNGNPDPTDPDVAVNNWIQEVMDDYYYWNSIMNSPIAMTSDPEDYFDALLVEQDRFSVAYPNYQELINSLEGVNKEAGYEFTLFRESSSNQNVIAVVLYIKKGSPAEEAGLLRDDIITEINGTTMTLSNYQSVLGWISEDHSLTVARYDDKANEGDGGYSILEDPLELIAVELSENPILLDSVYTIGSHKIGYLMYNFFSPGDEINPDDEETFGIYDQQIDDIFADFKAEGINNLILDLRYNGGGFVTSAINLASLIAPGVTSGDIFHKTKYNEGLQAAIVNSYGADFLNTTFTEKIQNIGNQLSGNTIYIIATDRTASASELIINGLSPYMSVKLIGETTYGKNVGSTVFQDEDNPDNPYGLLPIISQSFNSLDQSDYFNGFKPDVESNEFDKGNLLPLGDTKETMLSVAIGEITGEVSSERNKRVERREELGNSITTDLRFAKMIGRPIRLQ
ncbi:S41 family peptidase [Echinicola sediminis]